MRQEADRRLHSNTAHLPSLFGMISHQASVDFLGNVGTGFCFSALLQKSCSNWRPRFSLWPYRIDLADAPNHQRIAEYSAWTLAHRSEQPWKNWCKAV
jgi:hypothetical protein